MIRIGVDIGGTNTDAVVVESNSVRSWAKCRTTEDVTTGIISAVREVMQKANLKPSDVQSVMVGTTHFVNAVIQRKSLTKVAVFRLCLPAGSAIKPFADWPADLQSCIESHTALVPGGFEYNGQLLGKLSRNAVEAECQTVRENNITNVAVIGIFSAVNSEQEETVAKWIRQFLPDVQITLSHEIGRIGLLERENATILNASLKPLAKRTVAALKSAFARLQLGNCQLFLTHNDGTLMNLTAAEEFPIFTFSSGPTNSMRGAAFLAQLKNAVVVDIGGSTMDVGHLISGFPRLSAVGAKVGGVRSNFHLPEVHSVGLGGGSVVQMNKQGCDIGPLSVANELESKAVVFGGGFLTATDIAVAGGLANVGYQQNINDRLASEFNISHRDVQNCVAKIKQKVEMQIDEAKLRSGPIPVILVGGGSILVGDSLEGASEVIRPPHYSVANAVGAAIAQVSGAEESVISMLDCTREEAKSLVMQKAIEKAVQSGADPKNTEVVEYEEIPLGYLPGKAVRYRAKAVGDLLLDNNNVANVDKTEPNENFHIENEVANGLINGEVGNDCAFHNNQEGKNCLANGEPGKALILENSYDPTAYKPTVIDGVWQLSATDVDYITTGAAVLGSGGGGNPYQGKLILLEAMQKGTATVIKAEQMVEGEIAIFCGGTGDPCVVVEKIFGGKEFVAAFQALEDAIGKKAAGVMSFEVGGFNTVIPMIISALTGIPRIDGDGIGRAFPEMQHFIPFIKGHPVGTLTIADEHGHICIVKNAECPRKAESLSHAVCVEMGCQCAMAFCPLTKREILAMCHLNTISQVWEIGRILFTAKHLKLDCIEALAKSQGGKLLISGSISDISREIVPGFHKGDYTIMGTGKWKGETVVVDIQNENLVAKLSCGKVLATVPDVITSLETETGRPLGTEELRYGLRVTLISIPAHPVLQSELALTFVGPRAFGYDLDYKPSEGLADLGFSVIDKYSQ